MEYPLSYYEKRNKEIVREFRNGREVEELCVRHKLGRRQMLNILRYNGILIVERKRMKQKKTPKEILAECGMNKYEVRGALIRAGVSVFKKIN